MLSANRVPQDSCEIQARRMRFQNKVMTSVMERRMRIVNIREEQVGTLCLLINFILAERMIEERLDYSQFIEL
jgi:hypothetical protein